MARLDGIWHFTIHPFLDYDCCRKIADSATTTYIAIGLARDTTPEFPLEPQHGLL